MKRQPIVHKKISANHILERSPKYIRNCYNSTIKRSNSKMGKGLD
jgi:hypothetical protein